MEEAEAEQEVEEMDDRKIQDQFVRCVAITGLIKPILEIWQGSHLHLKEMWLSLWSILKHLTILIRSMTIA